MKKWMIRLPVGTEGAISTLCALVAVTESGELTAPPLLAVRLERAIVALEAIAAGRQPTVDDFDLQ